MQPNNGAEWMVFSLDILASIYVVGCSKPAPFLCARVLHYGELATKEE